MFMLYLLIGILAVCLFWMLIAALNAWGEKRTGHTFFTAGTVGAASLGYWMLFFGHKWYAHAQHGGDPLNGVILILLGAAVLGLLFLYQVAAARSSRGSALLLTLFFFALCLPMSVVLFAVVVMLIAWFSETKPVYTVNHLIDDN